MWRFLNALTLKSEFFAPTPADAKCMFTGFHKVSNGRMLMFLFLIFALFAPWTGTLTITPTLRHSWAGPLMAAAVHITRCASGVTAISDFSALRWALLEQQHKENWQQDQQHSRDGHRIFHGFSFSKCILWKITFFTSRWLHKKWPFWHSNKRTFRNNGSKNLKTCEKILLYLFWTIIIAVEILMKKFPKCLRSKMAKPSL